VHCADGFLALGVRPGRRRAAPACGVLVGIAARLSGACRVPGEPRVAVRVPGGVVGQRHELAHGAVAHGVAGADQRGGVPVG
ncbi:hypothetical protein LAN13_24385, partial [Mycobacterium tuberculosis]|nr:hypothetical protein [Mycobacterium tuberculosis]